MHFAAVTACGRHSKFGGPALVVTIILLILLGIVRVSAKSESSLRVGNSINVFVRYGYLSISMKVISYNDTERWLFKEPTNQVFRVS